MIRGAALAVAALALGCGGTKRRPPGDAGVAVAVAAPPVIDASPPLDAPIDAPPRPAVVEPTGVTACDRLQAVLIEALACPQLAEHRATIRANFDVHQQNFAGWPALPPAERKAAMKAAAARCQGAVDGLVRTMTSAGC